MEKKSNKKTSKEATKKNGVNAEQVNNTNAATAQEPTTEEPTAEEPTTEEPTTEEPTTEEPTAEEPTAEEPTAEEPTAEERTPLATIGDTELHLGDTFRLRANPNTDSASVEVNPTDNARNADKPNNWNAAIREAYKALQRACIGLRVRFTFTNDRRAIITETAIITGCGMDTTNDRATFTLSTGRKVASGYTFRVMGYDPDRASTQRANKLTEDTRNAADIRRDIADKEARRDKLTRQIDDLKQLLWRALQNDLQAVREALTANPTDRRTLAAAIATPTANRITPEEADGLLQALKAVEGIPAAAAAVRLTMEQAHTAAAVLLMEADPQAVANADEVADVMRQHGLKLGDIPTDILPD